MFLLLSLLRCEGRIRIILLVVHGLSHFPKFPSFVLSERLGYNPDIHAEKDMRLIQVISFSLYSASQSGTDCVSKVGRFWSPFWGKSLSDTGIEQNATHVQRALSTAMLYNIWYICYIRLVAICVHATHNA